MSRSRQRAQYRAGEVLVVRHVSWEGAGAFGEWLDAGGVPWRYVNLFADQSMPDLRLARALLVIVTSVTRLRTTSAVLARREIPGWQGGGPLKRSEQRRPPRGGRPNRLLRSTRRHLKSAYEVLQAVQGLTVGTPTARAWYFAAGV